MARIEGVAAVIIAESGGAGAGVSGELATSGDAGASVESVMGSSVALRGDALNQRGADRYPIRRDAT
jgi:hypothetical protein